MTIRSTNTKINLGNPFPTADSLPQRLTELAMILAPLLSLIGFWLHSLEEANGGAKLTLIARQSFNWSAAHILFLCSMAFFILAVSGIQRLIRPQEQWLGWLGTLLVVLRGVFFSALFGAELALGAMATVNAKQFDGMAPAVDAITSGQGPLTVVMLGLAFNLGLVFLAIALFLNPKLPRWAAVLAAVGGLILVSAAVTDTYGALSSALLLLGLGAIGVQTMLLRV